VQARAEDPVELSEPLDDDGALLVDRTNIVNNANSTINSGGTSRSGQRPDAPRSVNQAGDATPGDTGDKYACGLVDPDGLLSRQP
jgi:hypothetical protein